MSYYTEHTVTSAKQVSVAICTAKGCQQYSVFSVTNYLMMINVIEA